MSELVGNIETMMAKWHYYKDEVTDLLSYKANKTDVPTKTSELINDKGFIDLATYNEIIDAFIEEIT